jgi:radical SAM protein with 4Fe4S-binding SPASM domain
VHVVEISLYSHRAEVHDFVTGVPGSFEKTVAGIRHLVACGVDTHVKTPTLRVNEDEVAAYLDFVSSLGVTYTLDPEDLMPREGGDRAPESFSRSLAGRARLFDDKRLASDEPLAPRPERSLSDTLCGAGDSFHVEANGELRPCTMLEVPLGNVLVEGASAAREHNETLRKMLALRWRDVHGCRDCDLRAYCGRCYAAALAEVGDALAPYTSACANARQTYELTFGAPIKIVATADRNPEIGPYQQRGAHEFDTITDVVTAADEARARELGWVRRAGGKRSKPAPVRAGELVQIRRPGKQAKWVRVPESSAALADKQQQATLAFGANAPEAAT